MARIALDTQVHHQIAFELNAIGHDIMLAGESETDNACFLRAEKMGCTVFVSADYDWMNYALDRNHHFLHIQQGWSRNKVHKEITKLLRKIRKTKRKPAGAKKPL